MSDLQFYSLISTMAVAMMTMTYSWIMWSYLDRMIFGSKTKHSPLWRFLLRCLFATIIAIGCTPLILLQHLICLVLQCIKPLPIGMQWTFNCFQLRIYRVKRLTNGHVIPQYFKPDWEVI